VPRITATPNAAFYMVNSHHVGPFRQGLFFRPLTEKARDNTIMLRIEQF
jgi:hypothetical protein